MNQRFITFLTVAEAGSFFDAAQQLFVSYQCVSAHVRSLEEEYGVKLVEHRPRFALTAEGQALLETLKKIRALEEGIAAELDGSGPEAKGHVTLGVPSARYTEIVPRIVPPFKKEYPHVELEVAYDYSNLLQNQVERGILDMAIVTQYNPRPQLNASVLLRDTYLFILSDRLLQVCVGSRAQEVDDLYKQNGITLEQMTQFPIVTYPVGSRLRSVMDEYTAQTGRKFHTVFASNRTEVLDALARTDMAGCIIPHQICGTTLKNNKRQRQENRLHIYPIDFEDRLQNSTMALIWHKESALAPYKRYLMDLIGKRFAEYRKFEQRLE